ncbi:MAG: hypothetical protein V4501_11250 [Pseudomonadota bacterium]
MALDSRYIPFYNIAQFIFDKEDTLPLVNGYVRFWVDTQRATPKEVFRLSGISPNYTYTSLGAVLTLGPTGAFVDGSNMPIVIYAFPYDEDGNIQRYYLEVFSEDDVPQFVVEATPYVFTAQLPPDSILNGDNELNNSQFVEVSFNSEEDHVYTFTGAVNEEVQLAPDWMLVASGTGTVTVERIALTEVNTPTNPPYVIDINSTGISTLILRQRFTNSPRLIAGGFVSAYFIAASQDSLQHALQMEYNPSGGTLTDNVIIDETISADGSYNVLQGNLEITGTINPDAATIGYVDIDVIIPVGAHLRLSSFQLVQVNAGVNIAYGQQSTPKQINTLFSYYKNSMQYMPKQSMVPWWTFGLNPLQFGPSASPVTAQCSYIFDQTILYQAGAGSKVNISIGSSSPNGTFQIEAASGASDVRFALITYIAPQSIQGWWGYWMSSLIRANLSTTLNTSVRIKVRLIWRETLPATIGAAEPIASWAVGTDPTFSAGWNAVMPLNDPAYTLGKNEFGTDAGDEVYPAFPFDQMPLPIPGPGADNMIGLVFYTYDALDSTPGDMDVVDLNEISLVPNQFAIASTPMTFDQVRLACNLYYYSSYDYGVAAGTVTTSNQIAVIQDSVPQDNEVLVRPTVITLSYPQMCTATPTITFYSPTSGTAGDINILARGLDGATPVSGNLDVTVATYWTVVTGGDKHSTYTYATVTYPITVSVPTSDIGALTSAIGTYFFTSDSRLGR